MGLVQKIFTYFHRKKIAKEIKRQIENWSSELVLFQSIELLTDKFVKINELKDYKKYGNIISLFDTKVIEVRNHNIEIEELKIQFDDIVDNHSIDNILAQIDKYSFEQLNNYNKIALQINKYRLPDTFARKDVYLRYMRNLGEIVSDYSKVVLQYSLIKDFYKICSLDDKYIDGRETKKILDKARDTLGKVIALGSKYYNIPTLDEKLVEYHNERYINNHLNDEFFNDINGKCLDDDQRRAILCDPISNLTIAGAGAGKTLTICGKVKWLLKTKAANADEILLLSYSKASATDLAEKVQNIDNGLTVKTFHSLGLNILNNAYGTKRAIEEQFKAYITKYFENELVKNQKMLNTFFRFFSFYQYVDFIDSKVYANDGERFADLKITNYQTLKDRLRDFNRNEEKKSDQNVGKKYRYETLKNEYVKSYEELVIANFLFANGVNYEYERAYKFNTSTLDKRQYMPDFYLTDYGIYMEHYGINEKGRTPQYSKEEEKKYLQGIEWKRQTHRDNNTTCLETYSYEFKTGEIFDNLKSRLINNGVELKPLSQEDIKNVLLYMPGQEINSFLNLITTFISLYKAKYPDAHGFENLKSYSFVTNYERDRAILFIDICKDIYEYYIKCLREQNKIDFDDMILQATNVLGFSNEYRYKYVIVDEFQDISQSRARFLKKILQHGNAKLFAVGDDWQAIYRFAGCDINIFLHFKDYFEDARLNFITSTHRNSAELQEIAEPFITANPKQFKKHIQSTKHQEMPVRIIFHDHDRVSAFLQALQHIRTINPHAEVLVLGRNRHDFNKIFDRDILLNDGSFVLKNYQFKFSYKTVHQSKGLESEFVILISGENLKNGFPNQMEDDKLLNLVLSDKDSFEFSEERRLFYVALTRTRSIVFILSDINMPSTFVKEIERKASVDTSCMPRREDADMERLCPICKSGKLILRTNSEHQSFYGCSNFPYCNYKINDKNAVKLNNRCPDCGDFLVVRDGSFGKFIGCHNYPRCKYTRNIDKDYIGYEKIRDIDIDKR